MTTWSRGVMVSTLDSESSQIRARPFGEGSCGILALIRAQATKGGKRLWEVSVRLLPSLPKVARRCLPEMDILGIEPKASRMLSGCDSTRTRVQVNG